MKSEAESVPSSIHCASVGHSRFLFRTGRPLVHMQVEVVRRFRQIECRILRLTPYTQTSPAHFFTNGNTELTTTSSPTASITASYERPAAAINSGVLISAGVYPLSAPIPAGYFQFGRKHIDDINLDPSRTALPNLTKLSPTGPEPTTITFLFPESG